MDKLVDRLDTAFTRHPLRLSGSPKRFAITQDSYRLRRSANAIPSRCQPPRWPTPASSVWSSGRGRCRACPAARYETMPRCFAANCRAHSLSPHRMLTRLSRPARRHVGSSGLSQNHNTAGLPASPAPRILDPQQFSQPRYAWRGCAARLGCESVSGQRSA
jgi:hypothetical protein